ncbi:transposase [Atopobium sp. oral taxon 416]|uniref:transposase n=1 Tax=Atopobium sp. oral taxon 416 TaxID=712157 RepID=UPI002011D6C7|nr:transposase [Atopobium sp. oral taxon 416]
MGCLVWAQEGYGKEVLSLFLDGLTREQKSSIEVVTADAAKWIEELLWRRCPNARWVMDPFHVVEWINDVLERVRRDEWQAARQADRQARAAEPRAQHVPGSSGSVRAASRRMPFALRGAAMRSRRTPKDLSARQRERLLELKRAEGHLARAWTLKEDLEGHLPRKGCA